MTLTLTPALAAAMVGLTALALALVAWEARRPLCFGGGR